MIAEPLDSNKDSGAGSSLPAPVLVLAGICTLFAVLVSAMSIQLQLKNYRKPILQRMVIRIMVMVPLYGISSLIALFSLGAAFVIDVIRDIYEAFVIYCFFSLLLSYLGGERALLILLHGRPPKKAIFPVSIFQSEIDASDPHTFLFLKRGIFQYVQVKPVLAIVTLILKATGNYREGDFSWSSGYLYVTIIYNISICLALYCLGVFWLCINSDLKDFRPIPKFLCVKGILFFSFWQSLAISILVAAGVITKLGPYTDGEHITLGLTDILICIEMPFFAVAHMYAFSHTDYIDRRLSFVARMPMYYAFHDAFGSKDVVEDSKATLKGKGMSYREFEPADGYVHQGVGRDRRIRAGLRYSKTGKRKYWLPKPSQGMDTARWAERSDKRGMVGGQEGEVYEPLLAGGVVHMASNPEEAEDDVPLESSVDGGFELPFGDLDENDEELFSHSKKYLFGDYNYPCIDVSSEVARITMWDEEERVLRDERGAWFSPIRGAKGRVALERREGPAWEGYGAIGSHPRADEGKGKRRRDHGSSVARRQDGRSGEYTVDHEPERTLPSQAGDVRLNWTKMPPQGSASIPHRHRSPPQDVGALPASGSSTLAKSSIDPRKSRAQPASASRSRSNSHKLPLTTTLPLDAVDLVLEPGLTVEKTARERRNGTPVDRGMATDIYRQEIVPVTEDPGRGSTKGSPTNVIDISARETDEERRHSTSPPDPPSDDETPRVTTADRTLNTHQVQDSSELNPWA